MLFQPLAALVYGVNEAGQWRCVLTAAGWAISVGQGIFSDETANEQGRRGLEA